MPSAVHTCLPGRRREVSYVLRVLHTMDAPRTAVHAPSSYPSGSRAASEASHTAAAPARCPDSCPCVVGGTATPPTEFMAPHCAFLVNVGTRARNTRAWFPSAVPGRAVGHPTLPLKVHRPHDDRELHDRGVRAVRRKWLIQLVAATCVQVRLVVPGWGACSPRVKPFDGFEAHRLQGGGTYQRRANVFLVEPQH